VDTDNTLGETITHMLQRCAESQGSRIPCTSLSHKSETKAQFIDFNQPDLKPITIHCRNLPR